ncbi:MAG TPA: YibE/F family protein [Patescibacteria group bacterium]|nr:YibE/F family protein [Patescibacteria group bacterium]
MKALRFLIFAIIFSFSCFIFPQNTFAQTAQQSTPKDVYMTAQVLQFLRTTRIYQGNATSFQELQVKITSGAESGKTVTMDYDQSSIPGLELHRGDSVVIAKTANIYSSTPRYYFVDINRLVPIVGLLAGFLVLIIAVAGWKGFGSIAGLAISLGIIFFYIVPQIIHGADPLNTCMIGAIAILFLTTYIAHGISSQTTVGFFATLLALGITYYLSQFVVHVSLLTGYGNEEAADLHFGLQTMIDIKGIFLGGIILATVGALNDITITQSAALFALHKTNPSFTLKELISHGFAIGREHAVSLVNTLVLAYAGSALSLFIFFLFNPNKQPWWVVLNSEFLNEELMRTIAGTAGLLLSVPIVTFLASYIYKKRVFEFIKKMSYSMTH